MTRRRRVEKFPPLQGDKSLIVWAPPLRQCDHCQVCSERTVLPCTNSHGPLHYICKHQPTEPWNARGVSAADPAPRVTDSKVTVIWQYVTVERASAAGGLQSPGHPLTRHPHLALLIPSIPLHDSGDPVHTTRLSSDQSPGRTGITYNIITVISVPSSSAGRERIQQGVRWERSRGCSSRSPFGPALRTIKHFVCFAILSETRRTKNLLGNQEADFNGHIFMMAAF